MDKEFPCRTKVIGGIRYRVRILLNGEVRTSSSFETKDIADKHIAFMEKALPKCTFEIKEEPWTAKVCIECGEESVW